MTRQTRSPAQRATAALEVARRVERRAHAKAAKLAAASTAAHAEHAAAERRVTFLEKDPDLPPARERERDVEDPRPPREKPAKKAAPPPAGQGT